MQKWGGKVEKNGVCEKRRVTPVKCDLVEGTAWEKMEGKYKGCRGRVKADITNR